MKENRSVASGLSVIDFEHGEKAEGERAQKESCLEDSTERSESNPGQSLGIITSSKKELSGRQYHDLNKHPRQSVESVFENPPRYKSNTDLSDSTDLIKHQ